MKRNPKSNTCLTECVAYIFRMNPARVPFFIGHRDWMGRVKRFFRYRGLNIRCVAYDSKTKKYVSKHGRNRLAIVSGPSPRMKKRRMDHAVVYLGNTPIFDPSSSQKFLKYPEFYWIISKRR